VAVLRGWHQSDVMPRSPWMGTHDDLINKWVFGRIPVQVEQAIPNDEKEALRQQYTDDKLWLSGTRGMWASYHAARAIVRRLNLTAEDTYYDLGAGYGILSIYALPNALALNWPNIESMSPARVLAA
jgi:hypothetical protein